MTSRNTIEAKSPKEPSVALPERLKSPDPMVHALICTLWKEYLSIVEQGNKFISFEEFEELLEKGVAVAAKKQKKLQDEEIDRKVKSEQIAKWVDDTYGFDYD